MQMFLKKHLRQVDYMPPAQNKIADTVERLTAEEWNIIIHKGAL